MSAANLHDNTKLHKVSLYISRCSGDRKGKSGNVCTFTSVPISSSRQNNHKGICIKMANIAAWGLAWLGWPLKGLFPSEGRDQVEDESSKYHIFVYS